MLHCDLGTFRPRPKKVCYYDNFTILWLHSTNIWFTQLGNFWGKFWLHCWRKKPLLTNNLEAAEVQKRIYIHIFPVLTLKEQELQKLNHLSLKSFIVSYILFWSVAFSYSWTILFMCLFLDMLLKFWVMWLSLKRGQPFGFLRLPSTFPQIEINLHCKTTVIYGYERSVGGKRPVCLCVFASLFSEQRAFDSFPWRSPTTHKYLTRPKQVIENAFQANKRTLANV